MAKLTLTVIFSLFLLSHARIPLIEHSNLLTEYKPSDSENKEPLLTVPSDGSESETVEIAGLPLTDTETTRDIGIARPLTMITFDVGHQYPFNRHVHHMHMRHPFWFRRFPHRCRHHGGRHTVGTREISYGNDMIMSGESASKSGRGHPFGKPMTMRPYEVNEDTLAKKNFDEFLTMGVLTEEKQGHVDGEEFFTRVDIEHEKPMEKKKKEGGLMKKVRKFLDRTFDF